MSCDCTTHICLEPYYNVCSEGVELDVVADETGTWTARIEFNGLWQQFTFGVEMGEKVVIPASYLNGFYKHDARIYNVAGELVDCYWINGHATINAGSFTPVDVSGFSYVAEYDGNETDTQVFPVLSGATLVQVGYGGQEYNSDFWTQTGTSVTLSSGAFIGVVVLTYTKD